MQEVYRVEETSQTLPQYHPHIYLDRRYAAVHVGTAIYVSSQVADCSSVKTFYDRYTFYDRKREENGGETVQGAKALKATSVIIMRWLPRL